MSNKPAQRAAMLAKHLSTTAPALAQSTASVTDEAVVQFEAVHSLRKMTLNRPKFLNALNAEMVNLIQPQLEKWEKSPLANVILFKGTGGSFCAGGDVVTLVKQLDEPANWNKSSEFFQKEYAADAYIAKMTKPVVTIMQGNTLGGGVGLSVHAPFRIATETTKLAMPETAIGLFPDVGATFFLSRLDGKLGLYLGLTGDRVAGVGALFSGLATHFVPSERLPALEARLAELASDATHENVNAAIEEFVGDASDMAAGTYNLVGSVRRAIDFVFARETVEEIMADLAAIENGTFKKIKSFAIAGQTLDTAALAAWAKATKHKMDTMSPTSVKLAHMSIREGRTLNIDEAFSMDMRIATACCNPEIHPDFKVGVTSKLINKSSSVPAWSPSTLEGVKVSDLQRIFFSSPPPFKNPALPVLSLKHPGKPFTAYPHAKYSLPSEATIKDIVTGDAKGSGKHALTANEVVQKLLSLHVQKVGVSEKVREVLSRNCRVGESDTLTWIE